jgi:hypothetical protein
VSLNNAVTNESLTLPRFQRTQNITSVLLGIKYTTISLSLFQEETSILQKSSAAEQDGDEQDRQ